MKRIISITMVVLCLSLIVVLFAACGGKGDDTTTTTNPTTSESQVSTTEPTSIEDATVDVGSMLEKTTTADKPQSGLSNSGSSGNSSNTSKPPKTTAPATKPATDNNSSEGVSLVTGSIYDNWY